MNQLFDTVSLDCSKKVTTAYSTSFSLGIKALDKRFHSPIYAIYGYVRFADEIVDTFHDYNKRELLEKFREIENEKSNPSIRKFFQKVKSFWNS